MKINLNKIQKMADTAASKAKPFTLVDEGKTYKAVFDMREYVYNVTLDGEHVVNINMKSATKAKQFLKQWLHS